MILEIFKKVPVGLNDHKDLGNGAIGQNDLKDRNVL